MSSARAPRVFWSDVTVTDHVSGFGVALDGRPVRTPAKAELLVPTRAFAEAVAQEWREQEKTIDPTAMPGTRLANVALDKVPSTRGEVAASLAEYGETDLVCYRAETPRELAERQATGWDPIVAHAAQRFGFPPVVVSGIMHTPQPQGLIENLTAEIAALTDFQLAAFHELVSLSGSVLLAFALVDGIIEPATAWGLSRLDEEWQAEQWGRDEDADALSQRKQSDFLKFAGFFKQLKI